MSVKGAPSNVPALAQCWLNTEWCRYNEFNFLPNHRNRLPIVRPWGRDMTAVMMTSSNGNILLAICAGNSPSPGNSPHKDQWRRALVFSLICAWTNGWVNNGEAGDLRRHRAHYDRITTTPNQIYHSISVITLPYMLTSTTCNVVREVSVSHSDVILNSNLARLH